MLTCRHVPSGRPWPETKTDLSSVLELRDSLVEEQHSGLLTFNNMFQYISFFFFLCHLMLMELKSFVVATNICCILLICVC